MSPSIVHNPASSSLPDDLRTQLQGATPSQQIPLLAPWRDQGEVGHSILMAFLQEQQTTPTLATGRVYQWLRRLAPTTAPVATFLERYFPQGIYPLSPLCQVDHSPVQLALGQEDFETADRLTLEKLCELAGPNALKRKWLYFTEVNSLPVTDLQTLDELWQIYSEGRFGFSRQRELWIGLGRDWDRLWPKIAWKDENIWTRYPGGFIWDLSAPVGHLPLSNQLRGVRVMEALLEHPAWER